MINKKRHILFLSPWYPHRYDSLFGLFVQRHAESVVEKNDVSVIYICPIQEDISAHITHNKDHNIDEYIYYYSKKGRFNQLISPLRYFLGFFKLYRVLLKQKQKPDITHVNILTRVGVFALLLKYFKGIPFIITEHWSRYQKINGNYKGWFRKFLTKFIVKKASAVTTVSNHLKKAMNAHGLLNENWHIVPNVVDVDFFTLPPQKSPNKTTTFIHVSCFEEKSKNLSGILQAFHELSKQQKAVKLFMIGEGMDFDETKALSDRLNLTDKYVFFTGKLEGKALLEKFHEADAMLLYSHYENLPVVILEAMSCGLPLITSDVGGIKEFFNEKCGLIIPPNNTPKLTESLLFMMSNHSNYNKNDIRDFAIQHFSRAAISNQFQEIYEYITASGVN